MNQQIKATLASFPSLMSFSLIQHPPTQENSYNYTVSMLKVMLQLFQGEETEEKPCNMLKGITLVLKQMSEARGIKIMNLFKINLEKEEIQNRDI